MSLEVSENAGMFVPVVMDVKVVTDVKVVMDVMDVRFVKFVREEMGDDSTDGRVTLPRLGH